MNNSKIINVVYWVTTGLFSVGLLFAGIQYLTNPAMVEAFNHLGFPSYFRVELGIAKILGAIALLVPQVPKPIKNFAYAGFAINLVSAFIAHAALGDGAKETMAPVLFGVLALGSYITFLKRS